MRLVWNDFALIAGETEWTLFSDVATPDTRILCMVVPGLEPSGCREKVKGDWLAALAITVPLAPAGGGCRPVLSSLDSGGVGGTKGLTSKPKTLLSPFLTKNLGDISALRGDLE